MRRLCRIYVAAGQRGADRVQLQWGLDYRHADWLRSSRLALYTNGSVRADQAYAPSEETYAETAITDRSFTGQTQDATAGSQGVYDFLLRQQSAAHGHWLAPDPAGLAAVDITNPQTWNRYAMWATTR